MSIMLYWFRCNNEIPFKGDVARIHESRHTIIEVPVAAPHVTQIGDGLSLKPKNLAPAVTGLRQVKSWVVGGPGLPPVWCCASAQTRQSMISANTARLGFVVEHNRLPGKPEEAVSRRRIHDASRKQFNREPGADGQSYRL